MIDFTIETEIARSPAEVFAYVTEVEVVEHEPNRAFAMHTIERPPIHAQITVEPTGDVSHRRRLGHRAC